MPLPCTGQPYQQKIDVCPLLPLCCEQHTDSVYTLWLRRMYGGHWPNSWATLRAKDKRYKVLEICDIWLWERKRQNYLLNVSTSYWKLRWHPVDGQADATRNKRDVIMWIKYSSVKVFKLNHPKCNEFRTKRSDQNDAQLFFFLRKFRLRHNLNQTRFIDALENYVEFCRSEAVTRQDGQYYRSEWWWRHHHMTVIRRKSY